MITPSFARLPRAAARAAAALACALLLAPSLPASAAEEVNIYSYREPQLIQPMLKAFTEATGIQANLIFAKDGLVERLAAEGRNSPADLLLTNEFGLLTQAQAAGITQSVKDAALEAAVPPALRDPEGHWFALTRRARVIYVAKDRVNLDAITYEDLADPKWKGKICTRSGQHTYNVALIASMIAHHGPEAAEKWLTGVKANLARKPSGGDREAIRDVAAGLCDIAIGNTYYYAGMLKNAEQKPIAEKVRLLFPNASGRGTHVNISGVALAANAPHKANALKLMEFLASPMAQKLYAEANGEYPVSDNVPANDVVTGFGPLKADQLPLAKIGELRKAASELADKVRFDAGP
jgi:iron(III) transport system substrate-binding protein